MSEQHKHQFTNEFLSKYEDKTPPWGPVGFITYKRTYARWLPTEGRTETWLETCKRVLEGNFNILPDDPTITQHEMETAFDHMFNMRWLPPGRGLWISGTSHAKKNGSALNNCYYITVEPRAYARDSDKVRASFPFVFTMDMLMLGGGVGFGLRREHLEKFGQVKSKVNLTIVCDPKHANVREINSESIPPRDTHYTYIRVPDSRQGWTDALRVVIDAHWKQVNYDYNLVIDVSDVRPAGRRIKGFGGVASGPGPLVDLLRSINDILNARSGDTLRSTDALDVLNLIGKCVIAGNVRRSAQIALGDVDDQDFVTAKLDQDALMSHRWASNNSVYVTDDFNNYELISNAIAKNGEPGIINLDRVQNYGRYKDGFIDGVDGLAEGTNPCGEISLESGECCNLVEIFPAICLRDNADLEEVALIAYRYAKRVTFTPHDWHILQDVVSKNRRLGVSISGWDDFKLFLGSSHKALSELDSLYDKIKKYDDEYSRTLNCSPSIKLTTVKPSGSVSLLNGSSPGRHRHYSKFYIRRIRIADTDPIVNILKDAGFHVEADAYSPKTVVASFPVKAPTAEHDNFVSANEDPLEDQMKDQYDLQTFWADNSVSSTLTFKEEEAALIPQLLESFKFKSTSLLPYSNHGYNQAPYEPISEQQYNEMMEQVKYWPSDETEYKDKKGMEILDSSDCLTGSCPIK